MSSFRRHEETGLPPEAVEPLRHLGGAPLDVDVHPIPANAAKGEPAYSHFDFRFVFVASLEREIRVQAAQVTGHRWITLEQTPLTSVAAKLSALLAA